MPGTIDLGDIVFGLGPDTSRLRSAMRDILDFGTQVEQAAEMAADGGAKIEAAFRKQEAAIVSAVTKMQNFNQTLRNAGAPPQIIKNSQDAFKNLNAQMTSGVLAPLQYQRAMEQFTTSMARNQRAFKEWKDQQDQVIPGGSRLIGALQSLATSASLVTGPLGGLAFRLSLLSRLMEDGALKAALIVGGSAAAAIGFTRLAEHAIHAQEGITRMQLQLESLSGSLMKSQLDMKFVLDTADKFGVPFEDVAQHFAHLELATRGTTLEGQKMRDMFQDITAYATRFGLTQQQLDTILNQVTESLTRQRINVQNLRGIMSSVPAAQSIAADAVAGGSQAVFEQMLKRGHVWAESFWADFWKSANQRYGVDPTKAVDNLFTSQGRFKNAILELNNAMNAALGFTDAYKSSLDLLTNTMHFLARNIDTVIKVVGVFGATLAGAILGYEIIAKGAAIISMFQALARAISLTGVAAMFAAGPMALIFGIGGAIAAGVGALVLLNSAIDTNRDKLLGTLPVIKDYIKAYEDSKKAGSERTAELLKEANAELIKAQASLVAATAMKESTAQAAKEAGAPAAKTWWDTFLNYFNEYGKSLGAEAGMSQALIDATNKAAASAATAQADEARKRVTDIQGDITKLQGMLKAQQDYEKSIKSTQHAPSAWDTRNSVTLREYNELLQNTVDQYNAMKESAKDAAAQIEQAQLDKTVEQWRKKFQELGYSMTEINKKTQTLSDALTKLQKAKDFDKDFMSLGQTLEYSFGTLGKDALDKFVTAMNNGTISSMKFRDFVVSGLEAVEKKILELAVLNPILNSLFGASNQTFSWFSGGTNTGGLIGKLLTAGGFQSGPAAAAIPTKVGAAGSMEVPTLHGGSGAPSFGFFDPSIFLGAPRLHSGLAPDEFPAILQDGETVTPKGARISGGDTFVNINGNYHDYNGGKDRAQQKQGLSAMRRELEGLIDSRLIEARRPGGIYNRVNNPFGSKT